LHQCLREHDISDGGLVVGVSGGPDSLCLLHLLAANASSYNLALHVVHVHHGLRGADADADAAFVQREGASLGLPVRVLHVDVGTAAQAPGVSVEEAARQWRYALLGGLAEEVGARWVAVAHNADDQVESVLMHLIRGAGLAGLRGMRPLTWFALLRLPLVPPKHRPSGRDLWLIRPLLRVPRREIEAWIRARGLSPRFDRSNLDTTYFRNRLRHDVLPLLETLNPQIRYALFATGELAAADFDLLHPISRSAWAAVRRQEGPGWVRYDLARWRALPVALRRAIVRDAVMHLRRELRDIGFRQVEQVRDFLESAEMPAGSEWTLPAGLIVRREYDTFLIAERKQGTAAWEAPQVDKTVIIEGPGTVALRDGYVVRLEIRPLAEVGRAWAQNPDRWVAYFDADALAWPLRLRPRQEGDRMEPLGMEGKRVLVSEIMINAKVPRWLRRGWPLLVDAEDEVLWIAGVRQGHRGRVTDKTERVLIVRVERVADV